MPKSQPLPARLYQADGSPRQVGVIGYPVAHSLSPAFQNVAFEYHKLPHSYQKWEVTPENLPGFIQQVRSQNFLGINVTLPHKQAVSRQTDILSEEAAATGSANTLFFQEGQLAGHTTDVAGFLEALQAEGYSPDQQSILVIGAGGAARAVVYGLARAGAREIAIANRTLEKASELSREMAARFPQCNLYGVPLDSAVWSSNRNRRSLIVNTTSQALKNPNEPFPVSVAELAGDKAGHETIFFDLTYGDTPFLRAAKAAGVKAIDGLTMLVFQGAHSFELWTGLAAPRQEMLEAARAALSSKNRI